MTHLDELWDRALDSADELDRQSRPLPAWADTSLNRGFRFDAAMRAHAVTEALLWQLRGVA